MSEDNKQIKKAKGRRAYLQEFTLDENGEYVFTGDTYFYDDSEISWSDITKKAKACFMFLLVAEIIVGFLPTPGMIKASYVILPYGIFIIVLALAAYRFVQIMKSQGSLRDYIYKKSAETFPGSVLLMIILIACCLVGEIIYVFFGKPETNLIFTAIAVLLHAFALFMGIGLLKTMQAMEWKIGQNK